MNEVDVAVPYVDRALSRHRNRFVISTAVFPTVGTANAALSLRGAEAVRRSLAEGEVSR